MPDRRDQKVEKEGWEMHIKIVHLCLDCIFIISSCQEAKKGWYGSGFQLDGLQNPNTHTQNARMDCQHFELLHPGFHLSSEPSILAIEIANAFNSHIGRGPTYIFIYMGGEIPQLYVYYM